MTETQFENMRLTFRKELQAWIDTDPRREALLVDKGLISKSSLRQVLGGYVVPGKRTISAIRILMESTTKSAVAV